MSFPHSSVYHTVSYKILATIKGFGRIVFEYPNTFLSSSQKSSLTCLLSLFLLDFSLIISCFDKFDADSHSLETLPASLRAQKKQ